MTGKIEAQFLLRSLGFVEDGTVMSDDPGGMVYNFGDFKLFASFVINRRFQSIVQLSAVMVTPRTLTDVQCELPREFESREQGIAWVTWCLDSHSNGLFVPTRPVAWLTEGRAHQQLLPWIAAREAYQARPHCLVERDFARPALRRVGGLIKNSADDVLVTFSFDGQTLAIRVGDRAIVVQASGNKWPADYSLPAGRLRELPKRLQDPVCFSVWRDRLEIGRSSYSGLDA